MPQITKIMRWGVVVFITILLQVPLFSQDKKSTVKASSQKEWVVYATDVGWLRVGSRTEYEALWKKKDEIWGGTSEDTLKKTLLLSGFSSRNEAVEKLCGRLTRVQLHIAPPARGAPTRYITTALDTGEYNLRLTEGFSKDDVEAMSKGGFFKGLEYDWEEEWNILAKHNITPRYIFPSKQWLIHATGRSTRQGGQKIDTWMCFTRSPDAEGNFTIPLADGTTQGHQSDKHYGPFLDSYTMSSVMKKNRIKTIDLWPPVTSIIGRDVQPRVDAEAIPDNAKDYGDDILPQQPILPDTTMDDWVIYSVEDKWLHIGTRYEFKAPLLKNDVLWEGNSEEKAKKILLAPSEQERFYSRGQALSALCLKLTDVTTEYHPMNEPKETIKAKYMGIDYILRIDRGDMGGDVLQFKSLHYDYHEIWKTLTEYNITPMRTFSPAKLIHATGHGTYSGGVKDDLWMLVPVSAVKGEDRMVLPDGMGGTFTYSIDFASEELKSNYDLAPLMRSKMAGDEKLTSKLGTLKIYAEQRYINADEVPENPKNYGTKPEISKIKIKEIIPPQAKQGDSLGVTIIATGIDKGNKFSLGKNINITNMVYGGCSLETGYDMWYCTLKILGFAEEGKRTATSLNYDGGMGTLSEAFEVLGEAINFPPFIKLVSPASKEFPSYASECSRYKGEQEREIETMKRIAKKRPVKSDEDYQIQRRKIWEELRDTRIKMEVAEEFYWKEMGYILGDFSEDQINTIAKSLKVRCKSLLTISQGQLDELRETIWNPLEDSDYSYNLKRYRDTIRALEHSLNLWRNFTAFLQERREFEVQMARREKDLGGKIDLPSFQRKLYDMYIMKGEESLVREQMRIESGLQEQDSYGTYLHETRNQSESVKISDETLTAMKQRIFIASKYFVGINITMFSGVVGLIQNWFDYMTGDYYQVESPHRQISKQIQESRDLFVKKWDGMKNLANLDYDEIQAIMAIISDNGPHSWGEGAKELDDDRNWLEDTNGGLIRLAACFDKNYTQLKESEYQIMLKRSEISLRDMQETLNIKRGANPKTGEVNTIAQLFDPLKLANRITLELFQGEFSSRDKFLERKKAEIKLAKELLPELKKLNFDFSRLKYHPQIAAKHDFLRFKNPEYLLFFLKIRTIDAKRNEDIIEHSILQTFGDLSIHKLKRMRALARIATFYLLKSDYALYFRLEGVDRLMMWDWHGALYCFDQAAKTDPKIQSPEGVENLRKALDYKISREMWKDAIEHIGNLGFYSAAFGTLGRMGGQIIHKMGFNPWGMAVGSDAAMTATEAAGIFGRFGTMKYWAGFAEFTIGQINPFVNLVTYKPEWELVKKGTETLKKIPKGRFAPVWREVMEEIVSPELSRKFFVGVLGFRKENADMLAEAIVESSEGMVETNKSLAAQDARYLNNNLTKWERYKVNIEILRERAKLRPDLVQDVKILDALYKAEFERDQIMLQLARVAATEYDFSQLHAQSQALEDAENQVRNQIEPVTRERIKTAIDDFSALLKQASTPKERLDLLVMFFNDLSFEAQRELFKNNVRDQLCIQSDQFRREILDITRALFLADEEISEKYKDWFTGYAIYGSAAHPEWQGYKRLLSDLDITALLKENTPKEIRENFKKDFDKFFVEITNGMEPEALDIHIFADARPVFRSKRSLSAKAGVSWVQAFMQELSNNPALAQKIHQENVENLQLLWQNMIDPERYLLPGNLMIFNYLVKQVGTMHSADLIKVNDHYELKEDRAGFENIYQNLEFESWHGLDIVIDHFIHITHVRELNANDMFAYSKDLAKYCMRILGGRVIQTTYGLNRLASATPQQVGEAGGLEAFIVQVAKEIGAQQLGMTPSQMNLMDEWVKRKEARDFGEIFENRAGEKLKEDDFRLNKFVAQHINESETFILESINFVIGTQAAHLFELMYNSVAEQNAEVRQALEAQFRLILCSQAALWHKLRPDEKRMILLKAPANARYWKTIELFYEIESKAKSQASFAEIETYWPIYYIDDDKEPVLPLLPNVSHPFEQQIQAY